VEKTQRQREHQQVALMNVRGDLPIVDAATENDAVFVHGHDAAARLNDVFQVRTRSLHRVILGLQLFVGVGEQRSRS